MTDAFYDKVAGWVFSIADEGQERSDMLPGDCNPLACEVLEFRMEKVFVVEGRALDALVESTLISRIVPR